MPRTGAYVPWSSKNCLLLEGMPTVRDLNEDAFRVLNQDKTVPIRKRGDGGRFSTQSFAANDKSMFAGRPHTEEGYLIFRTGTINENPCAKCLNSEGRFKECISSGAIHKGACANCVLQSATNGCACASAHIAKVNDMKEETMGEKLRQKATRGTVSSKRKRRDAGPESEDEEREEQRTRLLALADRRADARASASPEKRGRGGRARGGRGRRAN